MDYTTRITNLRSTAKALAAFAQRQAERGVAVAEHAASAADHATAAANLYERGETAAAHEARNAYLQIAAAHRLEGIA